MLITKQTHLKPIIESQNGFHLTSYLENRGDLIDLKSQIRATIDKAEQYLDGVTSNDEKKRFLEPLCLLLNDSRILKQMKGNIGIFRNETSFRLLNIPIPVEYFCQLATSFHVKPLLRWLQVNSEFLFLSLEKNTAHLYFGSDHSFRLVDSISYRRRDEALSWLNLWISDLTKRSKPKLFIAGERPFFKPLLRNLKYSNLVKTPVFHTTSGLNVLETVQTIRNILREETKKSLQKTLNEFKIAVEGNKAKKNIFQIAKAAVEGKVRKLVVTDEMSIFGKIDFKSGGLAIHPFDLDHEDDCILDDLAQLVLNQGGEVLVAKREEIPGGRPILAILEDSEGSVEKTEKIQYQLLEERFG